MQKIIFFTLLISTNIFSQDLNKVDEIIFSYQEITSAEQLAKRIDYDFNTDLEKIRAAYTWIAYNIEYYKESSNLVKGPETILYTSEYDLKWRLKALKNKLDNKLVTKTISTKKAICKGYALTFKKICDLLNIENQTIEGFSKTNPSEISYLPKYKNHIWNAVKIKKKWLILDVTYGSGLIFNGTWKAKFESYYFNIKKSELNLTHYPSDEKWLKYMKQKSLKEFSEEPLFNIVFIDSNAKLIYPKNGKLVIHKKEDIKIKLKNIKQNTKISYSFDNENTTKKPRTKKYLSYTEIVLKTRKKNSCLNIYFNNELALQYRIVIK